MDRIAKENAAALTEITRREVELYAAYSPLAVLYPVLDDEHKTYVVVIIENKPSKEPPGIVIMARVVGDIVVVDEDTTDKPLVDALMINGGVPRDQIVLAYRGESLPDSESK
jgi:hypothetical protein